MKIKHEAKVVRGLARTVFVVMGLLMASPVNAQTQQQMNWCGSQDGATPQQRINGCTVAIKSGNYAGEDLAILFNNRGAAYADKNLYNLADKDYEQALTLKPNFAEALQNRENAYAAKKQVAIRPVQAPSVRTQIVSPPAAPQTFAEYCAALLEQLKPPDAMQGYYDVMAGKHTDAGNRFAMAAYAALPANLYPVQHAQGVAYERMLAERRTALLGNLRIYGCIR